MENWIAQLQTQEVREKKKKPTQWINWIKEKKVYVFMATHAETFDAVERSVTIVSRNGFHHWSNVNNNLLAIRIHWIELNFSDAFHFNAEIEIERLRFFQPQWRRRVPEPLEKRRKKEELLRMLLLAGFVFGEDARRN